MSSRNNQKAIFLPAERHAQFTAYADAHGLGSVAAFEQLFASAMEYEGQHWSLPSFDVEAALHKGAGCVLIGSSARLRLTPAEAHKLAEALLYAQDEGHSVTPVEIVPQIGHHTIRVSRQSKAVRVELDGDLHKLTYRLALDLANELIRAAGEASAQ